MDSKKKYNSPFFPVWKTADPSVYPHLKNDRKRLLKNINDQVVDTKYVENFLCKLNGITTKYKSFSISV